jgi:uncharacterized protein
MNKAIVLSILLLCFNFSINAQNRKTIQQIKLVDLNGIPRNIPYLGEKVLILFYVDPDVKEITDPISDALDEKKYPINKFGAVGVVNCKDSWVPNKLITTGTQLKQEKYPESSILLDKNYILSTTWSLGMCDNVAKIVIVGKDSEIKFVKAIKSQDECKDIIPLVIKIIEDEIEIN